MGDFFHMFMLFHGGSTVTIFVLLIYDYNFRQKGPNEILIVNGPRIKNKWGLFINHYKSIKQEQ